MKVPASTYIHCHQNSKPCKVQGMYVLSLVILARKVPMKIFIYKINLRDAGAESVVSVYIKLKQEVLINSLI
jgi:hypothetical protein